MVVCIGIVCFFVIWIDGECMLLFVFRYYCDLFVMGSVIWFGVCCMCGGRFGGYWGDV